MYTLKQIKDYLKVQPQIKFKNIEREDVKLSEFLNNILLYNKKYDTVFLNNRIHTEAGKRRSIGDLYRIASYYFPRVKLVTIYRALLKQIGEKMGVSAICLQTGLRVYRYDKGSGYFNGEATDEFYTDLKQFEEFTNCKSISDNWGYSYTSENINYIKI